MDNYGAWLVCHSAWFRVPSFLRTTGWTHGLPPNDWRVRAAAAADIPPASAAGHFVVGPSVATEAAALDEPFEHRQAVPASGAAGRPTGQPWSPRGASARTRGWQGARPAARSKPASSSSAATACGFRTNLVGTPLCGLRGIRCGQVEPFVVLRHVLAFLRRRKSCRMACHPRDHGQKTAFAIRHEARELVGA